MYKLWTRLTQECLNMYADHYNILRNSQKRFEQYRNTVRQLHTLVNVHADAKLSEQNLLMPYLSVLPSSVIDPQLGSGRQRRIWIVKGGYCADTRYAEKVKEINEQHERLVDMLKM